MARFDPETYPDRLTVEAYAHDMRNDEFDRVFAAAVHWVQRWRHQVAARMARVAATASAVSHGNSARPVR